MIPIDFEDCCDLKPGETIKIEVIKGKSSIAPDFRQECENETFTTLGARHVLGDTIFFFKSDTTGNEWCLIEEYLTDNPDFYVKVFLLDGNDISLDIEEPKNNDGRNTCFWCGEPTKVINTGFSYYDYCERCKK